MELILGFATILGGITAIWFFWDKFKPNKVVRLTNSEKVTKREELRVIFEDKLLEIKANKLTSDIILRDVDRVDLYPETSDDEGISSWFRLGLLETYHRGIRVALRIGSLVEVENGYRFRDYVNGEDGDLKVWMVGEIPFESIESINWSGDGYYGQPHIYCHFEHDQGEPYERIVFCEERELQPGMRYFSEIADFKDVYKNSSEIGLENFA
ncbi:hypothetical protein [Pseudocolwellia agarivorans]|uniref:hypothetical protein n=1 Tax=Pseudocolwellia agarivorans TaxID=1911682 RepID=UPI000987CC60|nr:hypothetical protein [Pseudocolwellia agarivorans]